LESFSTIAIALLVVTLYNYILRNKLRCGNGISDRRGKAIFMGGGSMRKVIDPQVMLGQVDISQIKFDLRSRDEIPKLLMGLQYIYCTPEIRREVFKVLETIVPTGTDANNGRPGMILWKILVLGTIRLNCNWDYDKVKEIADNHKTIRQMLGHSDYADGYLYPIQTIKDNVSLFTPGILNKINEIVVKAGHNLVKKKTIR